MRGTAIPQQGSEFHDFLYATVYRDQEGMELSVLSALARQEVDPWAEAARLCQLPQESAVKQIKELLDALPRQIPGSFNRAEAAGRLFALLPRRPASNLDAPRQLAPSEQQDPVKIFSMDWRVLTFYISLMLLINWIVAEFHTQSAASAGSDSPSGVVEEAPNSRPTSDSSGNAGQN
jgi:hypothetical protein